MADIYGQSDRQLATAGAQAYSDATQANIAAGEQKIKDVVAQMTAGINRAMTPEETASLNAQLESAKTQVAQAKADLQGQIGFARQQTGIAAAQTDQQLRDIQAAQLALAAQSLGQAGTVFTPGPSSTAAEGARLIQREAGITQGLIGGAGSVPAAAQVRTTGLALTPGSDAARGAELGLIGMNREGQDLFTRAITAGETRALADLDRQRINLGAQIEADARAASRERVAAETARVQSFEQNALSTMISNILNANNKVAELEAAAAASDNRTDKQKLELRVIEAKKLADIEAAKQIKIAKSTAKSSGLSSDQQAELLATTYLTTGASTTLGRISSASEKNMDLYRTTGLDNFIANPVKDSKTGKIVGKPVTAGGNANTRWTYVNGFLTQYPTGTVDNPGESVDVRGLVNLLTAKAGELQSITDANRKKTAWDSFFSGFTPGQRAALTVVYRTPEAAKPSWYYNFFAPAKTVKVTTVTPTKK
jgi:hypothetical protein